MHTGAANLIIQSSFGLKRPLFTLHASVFGSRSKESFPAKKYAVFFCACSQFGLCSSPLLTINSSNQSKKGSVSNKHRIYLHLIFLHTKWSNINLAIFTTWILNLPSNMKFERHSLNYKSWQICSTF